jgi:protein tyrosine phosphatase (PTP) superfamily phosphohydrolase (DUF442 family)
MRATVAKRHENASISGCAKALVPEQRNVNGPCLPGGAQAVRESAKDWKEQPVALARLLAKLKGAERVFLDGWGKDLSTPRGRMLAHLHFHLADHQFLRAMYANRTQVAPGVWRSNQPSPRRLRDLHRRGFRTILTLRGQTKHSFALLEAEACDALGLRLVTLGMSATSLSPRARMLELLDVFDEVERPFLIHCKSGADRTGLAAAMYLLHYDLADVDKAAQQLHWRFMHYQSSRAGILDHAIRAFGRARVAAGGNLALRDWLTDSYDPKALTAEWKAETGRA